MAHVTLFTIPATAFIPDAGATLIAGDAEAEPTIVNQRPALAFDDTNEEAALSIEFVMPGQYAGGTLMATAKCAAASDATNDFAVDFAVEAVTPGDTLDMEAADSFDASLNNGTASVAGTTAGDLFDIQVTLTNKDSVAAGDVVRIGIRRDCDSANDDASGDLYVFAVEIWEST